MTGAPVLDTEVDQSEQWDAPPIADYAVIGDTRTAALCSLEGSIDWLCLPQFDSEPVFGRLVGGSRSGSFSITPVGALSTSRRYRPGTAILETRWHSDTGTAVLIDAMVLDVQGALLPQAVLVRKVACDEGRLLLRVRFDPRRGLPGGAPRCRKHGASLICSWGSTAVALTAEPALPLQAGHELQVPMYAGEELTFVMSVADRSPIVFLSPGTAHLLLVETEAWWRGWSGAIDYRGAFREPVQRSLITLRLLTYSPSGAPVAAPTTSLPEVIGGSRNWDYRFSWPRDASIGVAAFLACGKHREARSFMRWLTHACRLTHPRLDVLYTLYGKRVPPEHQLAGVPGYRGSRPVRMGNLAGTQHQLDMYGWVVDAAWLLDDSGQRLEHHSWSLVRGFADFAARNWRTADAGIWERRGNPAHHVHSKLMAWLALDRAMRMGSSRGASRGRGRWSKERDTLAREVREMGFDHDRNTYVGRYGAPHLDAALLLLPVLDFEDDPRRVAGTVAAIRRELDAGGGLLYRYPLRADGLEGDEGAFLPCSFWLVKALAHLGQVDEASALFEHLLGFANDVGLLSEEADPRTSELLGNFPQALSHAALIEAAIAIEKASPTGSTSPDLSGA